MQRFREMSRRCARQICIFLFAFCATPLQAHHLSGYLQSALISIETNRVEIEMFLSPGLDIAPEIVNFLDADKNGEVSTVESKLYAEKVVKDLVLKFDDASLAVTLSSIDVPPIADLKDGTGYVKLHLTTPNQEWSKGKHGILFQNNHQPKLSSYLSNALVPESRWIQITGQSRNESQSEIRIDFLNIKTGGFQLRALLLNFLPLIVLGIGLVLALLFLLRRNGGNEIRFHKPTVPR